MERTPEPVEPEDAAVLELWDPLPGGSVDEAEPIPGPERQRRFVADRELVDRVQSEGLDGKTWHFLARELVAYATPRFSSWVRSGKIFALCRKKNIRVRRPPADGFSPGEAEELTEETVAFAVTRFQWEVLVPRVWDHSRGASLTTFFMGMCIKQFPTTYTAWCRQKERAARRQQAEKEAHRLDSNDCCIWRSEAIKQPFEPVLESHVANDINQAILRLRSENYSQAEISELLGISQGSIESRMYRLRRQFSAGQGDEGI